MVGHHGEGLLEEADHPVEPDAGQTVLGLELEAGVDDEDDVDVVGDHRPGVLGVAPGEADVDRPLQVTPGELLGVTAVDHHRPGGDGGVEGGEIEGVGGLVLVEQLPVLAVEHGVVDEVLGRRGLALGHEVDEGLLVRGEQGVVVGLLLPDRRHRLGRQVLAACRAGTVGRVDAGGVRQRHQLGVEAVIELVGQLVAGEPDRRQQVGATDVADEQGVAGEHAVGGVLGRRVDDDAQRLGCVARGMEELEFDRAERVAFAVGHAPRLELGLGDRREHDVGAGGLGQLEVPRQEVGVEVGLDHEFDREAVLGGGVEVHRDVALGVDHHGAAGGAVAHEVRRQTETVEVELLDHEVIGGDTFGGGGLAHDSPPWS